MKVIIHLVYSLQGGVANVAFNLINKQIQSNHKIVLVYCDESEVDINYYFSNISSNFEVIKISITKIPGYYMLFGLNLNKVFNYIRKKYSNHEIIVHAHNVQTIGFLSRLGKIPLICTIHGISNSSKHNLRSLISKVVYFLILNKLALTNKSIVAVSNATAIYYKRYLVRGNISTIHNGVPINSLTKNSTSCFTIGHVGDISFQKGWNTTYEAYLMLSENLNEKIKFYFAGKLIDYSEEMLSMLTKKNENIKYFGLVNNARINFIPKIDLLILASKSEGLPMVIVEAMSLGIPVLATDVGGISEILSHGNNGFFIKDSNDIYNRVLEIYNNKVLYYELCKNAKSTFLENFSDTNMSEEYFKKYNIQINILQDN